MGHLIERRGPKEAGVAFPCVVLDDLVCYLGNCGGESPKTEVRVSTMVESEITL